MARFKPPTNKELHAFRGDRSFTALATDIHIKGPNAVLRSVNWYGQKWAKSSSLRMTCQKVDVKDKGVEPEPAELAVVPPSLVASSDLTSLEPPSVLVKCKGNAPANAVPFEVTPRYLSDYRWPYNAMQLLPHARQVKLVVLLRNPTSRAWSAFFQNADPKLWSVEVFQDHVQEEIRILKLCYNSTLGLSRLSRNLNVAQLRQSACRDPGYAYAALQRCVQQYARSPDEPWFISYTQAFGYISRKFRPMEYSPLQGNVARGFYVDQLINVLCSGFEPENILVITNG